MALPDPATLREQLMAATRRAFESARKKFGADEICGFALYSDSEGRTVSATVNTSKNLGRHVNEDPDDADYYRWSPGEWAAEDVDGAAFATIRKTLGAATDQTDTQAGMVRHRSQVFDACVDVLEALVKEGFLDAREDTVVVVFAASDYEDSKTEKQWIKRLNSAALAKQFSRWMNTL